jgi:CheY-like chemotaxis protein
MPQVLPMIILNVDDDEEDIEIFCDAVREIDSTIICVVARSADEAMRILSSDIELPSYIFLDINMPKVDGNECLKEIRKHDRLKLIPVVMHSTHKRKADIEMYKSLNADFMVKQNSFNDLVRELRRILRK